MDTTLLRKEALEILGEEDLAGLMEWYEDTLESDRSYVVFVVRRSYILALIMEALTGKKMEENSRTCFLTDASLFLHCEKLARMYERYHRFPSILLCDETVVYGKNINHFIELMESRLISLLDQYEEEEIKDAFAASIRIHAYVRSDKPLLLLGRYQLRLQYKRRVEPLSLHRLSSNISTLILHSDIANAVYIYSRHLTEEQFQRVDRTDYVETIYQGTKQYAKIDFVGREEIKAVFSLRIIKNAGQEGYRVLPFVFLPNLSGEETEKLFGHILEGLRIGGMDERYLEWMCRLQDVWGKRTFNELVTLILGQVLLQEFWEQNGIDMTEGMEPGSGQDSVDKAYEVRKLARNYNTGSLEGTEAFLKVILSGKWFSSEDVARIICSVVERDRKLIRMEPGRTVPGEKEKQAIRERIEDYFWDREKEEESAAHTLSWKSYHPTRQRSERRVRGCGFLLWQISEGYTGQEDRYCIAFFLQMADAGVLALSSYASKNTRVVGFAQFAKAGELSQMIQPIRMMEWMPVIIAVEMEGEWSGRPFEEILRRYGRSGECDLSQEEIGGMIRFKEELTQMGQKARDWDWNYVKKKDVEGCERFGEHWEKYRMMMILRFMDVQIRHIQCYSRFREQDRARSGK